MARRNGLYILIWFYAFIERYLSKWKFESNIKHGLDSFSFFFKPYLLENIFSLVTKETKGRSSGQTPFTLKPKQLALKKHNFEPPKNASQIKRKNTFVLSNFLVQTLQ